MNLEATDREYAAAKILSAVTGQLKDRIRDVKEKNRTQIEKTEEKVLENPFKTVIGWCGSDLKFI